MERKNPHTTKTAWSKRLVAHVTAARQDDPIPARASLTAAQEMQCRILGGHLMHWLQLPGPQLISQRNALVTTRFRTKRPLLVFLTDTPGLVAAAQILGPTPKDIVYCRPGDLEAFAEREHDKYFEIHCELESYFVEPLNAQKGAALREEFSVESSGELWVHHECSVMGTLFERGARHLWHWDGSNPRLLREEWEAWLS